MRLGLDWPSGKIFDKCGRKNVGPTDGLTPEDCFTI